jgi:hypothetical protein
MKYDGHYSTCPMKRSDTQSKCTTLEHFRSVYVALKPYTLRDGVDH